MSITVIPIADVRRPVRAATSQLHTLVAIESECCAGADWSVVDDEDGLQAHLRATGAGFEAAHAMFR